MVATGGESAFWKPEIPYTGGAKKTELPVIAFGFAVVPANCDWLASPHTVQKKLESCSLYE